MGIVSGFNLRAQDYTDTLFYDAAWRLCEREPAAYYRIGTLRFENRAYYVGLVQDYYLDGRPEMKGFYNDSGRLHGAVVFYYPNGAVRIKGNFDNGRMTGIWSYYKPDGTLRISFYCNDHWDFAPVELRNARGKAVVQKGTGKFTLRTSDYPDIIRSEMFDISGEVYQGRREGNWTYTRVFPGIGRIPTVRNVLRSEKYVNGNFVRGILNPGERTKDKKIAQKPFAAISLYPQKLMVVDQLQRDWIFTLNKNNPYQLAEYLIERKRPVVELELRSQEENFGLYVIAIREALLKKPELESLHAISLRGYHYLDVPILAYPIELNDIPRIDAEIRFSVSAEGWVSHLTIAGKIDERCADLIRFYMNRLRRLYVADSERPNTVTLRLHTRRSYAGVMARNEIAVTVEEQDWED